MNTTVYPGSAQTAEIKDSLQQLEVDAISSSHDLPKFLRHFSSVIRFAAQSNIVSSYVLRDWIWIGSQLRIHASARNKVRSVASRLILYVTRQFEQLRKGDEGAAAVVRWATDHTISLLLDEVGVEGVRTFMSSEERKRAEDQWLRMYETANVQLSDIDIEIQSYLKAFDDVASESYLPDLSARIRMLLDSASDSSENSRWAAAALAYLVTNRDTVPDNLGYFGLVDDIFVLNQAFAMCCHQSPWLFLLDSFVNEWTDLARIVTRDQDGFSALPQYIQTVIGSVLFSMAHGPRSSCVVVPQSGEIAHFAAFFAALVAARKSAVNDPFSGDIQVGEDILLVSANRTVKARYQGLRTREDQTFHMVELANGNCSVKDEYLDAIQLAPKSHNKLSTSKEFQKWHDEYSPIFLEQLLHTKLSLEKMVPEVLLVTGRNRLERWLRTFRPMGKKVSELLGIRYFMRSGLSEDIAGTIGTKPLLVVCNDTFTATELLRSDDEAKACEHLRWVVVDLSAVTGDLIELQLAIEENQSLRGVFVTGLEQAESCRELHDSGAEQVYVAPDDVGVLGPRSTNSVAELSTGVYMEQIRTQRIKKNTIVEIKDEQIRGLHNLAMTIRSAAKEQDNSAFEILTYTLRQLIRKIIRFYYPIDNQEELEVVSLIDSCLRLANMVQAFHPDIPQLISTLSELGSAERAPQKKHQAICKALSESDSDKTALFCPSRTQAERLSARCEELFRIDAKSLVTIHDLRTRRPYDTLVIPGWFDKKQMRELRVSGFAANYVMVLYPFESDWERVSSKAQRRWSNHLLGATSTYAIRFESEYSNFSSVERWPNVEPIADQEQGQEEGVSDWPNEGMVAALSKSRMQEGEQANSVSARMVLFDDPEYFALLSPGGKAICIPEVLAKTEDSVGFPEAIAESLLNRPVTEIRVGSILAFPTSKAGDLLDSLADEILENSPDIRRLAGLWRTSLREYMQRKKINAPLLNRELQEIGIERHIATVNHWLFTDETVAPRSWRREIPLIGKLTARKELTENFPSVAEAIDRIYQARREAADQLLEQLRTGEIDLEHGLLTATIRETTIGYRVLRVARIESKLDVAAELVGKLHSVSDLGKAGC